MKIRTVKIGKLFDGMLMLASVACMTLLGSCDKDKDEVNSGNVKNVENGHEYVDLGLSVNWATCNVGATAPEGYGYYFAWGETRPKSDYGWSSYKYYKGSYDSISMTKYCTDSEYGYNGFTDGKTVLDPDDDAAHVNWGGNWRMPTRAEQDELRNNCTWTWTTLNGVNGYKVQSKKSGYTGNWIFLPAAGYYYGTYLVSGGSGGVYWSSSLYTGRPDYVCYFCFTSGDVNWHYDCRFCGNSVRPVCPKD